MPAKTPRYPRQITFKMLINRYGDDENDQSENIPLFWHTFSGKWDFTRSNLVRAVRHGLDLEWLILPFLSPETQSSVVDLILPIDRKYNSKVKALYRTSRADRRSAEITSPPFIDPGEPGLTERSREYRKQNVQAVDQKFLEDFHTLDEEWDLEIANVIADYFQLE